MALDTDDAAFVEAYRSFEMGNTSEDDRKLAVRFYHEDVEDPAATLKEGRPMFKTVECCEIRIPGNKDIIRGQLKHLHPDPKQRFPQAYAKFKAGDSVQVVGTPLLQWGLISSATARGYMAQSIHTVEQLAGLADNVAQGIPGILADRQKARDFVAMAKGQAPIAEARAENAKLKEQMAALQGQVEELARLLEQKTDPRKR